MHFRIDPAITAKYPHLLVGLLICRGVDNTKSSPEIGALLRSAEAKIRAQYSDPEALKSHPTIAAWQEVHRSFESNPNKFPSSVHALCKRVAKGGELPSINPLVDLYNVISLTYVLPVGGEDLEKCTGDIHLTIAEGTESFIPLGGTENEPPDPGEVLYRDDAGVLCRKFNWREAARTCLTEKTRNAVLLIEAVPPTTRTELDAALAQLKELISRFCGGTVETTILDGDHPSQLLDPSR
ncbi:MAG: B3/4 domain-containing protein [Candidatus Peregrinibacteria bacterium]|nr:B3/4 domain-containing protein [Candidatus Peregrinibacteria bacterium]